MVLVRVKWLKHLKEIEGVGRYGITSLVQDDIADVLEKNGYLEVLDKPKETKPKVRTRPVEK